MLVARLSPRHRPTPAQGGHTVGSDGDSEQGTARTVAVRPEATVRLERMATDTLQADQRRKKRGCVKTATRKLKDMLFHPIANFWRSTMVGIADLLADTLFCVSLYIDGSDSARLLFSASASILSLSVAFNFTAVIILYRNSRTHLAASRPSGRLFDLAQPTTHKFLFFLVILLSSLVNIRLAALLPWDSKHRRGLLAQTLRLHTVGKIIEDLPQLVIAAIYLSQRRACDADISCASGGGARGAATLQLVISGLSLLLTLLWLGLQVLDTKKIKETKVADGVFDVANAARMGRKWSLMTPRGKAKKGLGEEARASTSTSTATKRIMALSPQGAAESSPWSGTAKDRPTQEFPRASEDEVQGRHATRSGWFGRVSSVWTGADSASRKTGGATTKPKAAATKSCSHYSKASTTSTLGSESSAAPHDYNPEAATSQDELLGGAPELSGIESAGSGSDGVPGLRTRSAGTPTVDVLPDIISGAIAPVADVNNDAEAANLEGSQPSRLSDVGRELTARGQKKLSDGGGGGAGGGGVAGRKMSVESRLTAGKKKKSVMFASPGSAAPSEPPFTMDHV